MNEADSSPGNGAPAGQPAPTAPTAAPTAHESAPAVTLDQVKGLMTEMLGGFKNSVFADLRKSGALKKDEPAAPVPSAPAVPAASLTSADVQSMIAWENTITRVAAESKLTAAQEQWMRGAVQGVKADELLTRCQSFVTDLGLVRTEPVTSTQVPQTPQPQPNGHPISDRGSPAPGGVVNWERELAENPIGMSAAARSAMDAKYGREKAVKMRLEASQAQAARIKVTTNP